MVISVFAWLMLSLSISAFGLYASNVVTAENEYEKFYDACDYYYSLNERTGVKDPEPWHQEKRFDIVRARAKARETAVDQNEPRPGDLERYTPLPAPGTTVIPDWNKDHEALGDMCDWLTKLAQYSLNPDTTERKRETIRKVYVDFMHRYGTAMKGKFGKVFPWGKNWFHFSVTSTLMLCYYILVFGGYENESNSNVRRRQRRSRRRRGIAAAAAGGAKGDDDGGGDDDDDDCGDDVDPDVCYAVKLILKIIKDPCHSLTKTRKDANAVYMAFPWIVAHYVLGDVDEAAQDANYEYVLKYIKFPVVSKPKTEGLYMDCTYITHTCVLAYGYMSEMTRKSLLLVAFDNQMPNFLLDWRRVQHVLGHRTIQYGGIGLHARDTRLTQFIVPDSTYGIKVIPTCLFLRMYGEEYAFSMRGQVPWIAFYEADQTNNNNTMAQYWVQCRRVFFKDQEYKATFPEIGFMHQTYLNASSEEDKDKIATRCKIPSRTDTTDWFLIGPKRPTQALKAGFVFAYGTVGILRHFYYTPQMIYDPALQFKDGPAYGRYYVDEFVLCDYAKHTIDIYAKITKLAKFSLTMHGDGPFEMDDYTAQGIFHITWDCKARTVKHEFNESATTKDEIQEVYPKGIQVVDTDVTVMLLEDGQPKMAMYPDDCTDLKATFTTKYQDKEYEFNFDSLTNQYWLAGQCIDRI